MKDLNVEEFSKKLQESNTLLLDVRTPEEYKEAHLKNSSLIDFYNPDFKSEIAKLDKSKTYLIYCRSGRRSAEAMEIMESLGFNLLFNMLGGILEWQEQGKPVERK